VDSKLFFLFLFTVQFISYLFFLRKKKLWSVSINAAALHQHTYAGITKPPHRHCSRAALCRHPSTGSGIVNLLATPARHGQSVRRPPLHSISAHFRHPQKQPASAPIFTATRPQPKERRPQTHCCLSAHCRPSPQSPAVIPSIITCFHAVQLADCHLCHCDLHLRLLRLSTGFLQPPQSDADRVPLASFHHRRHTSVLIQSKRISHAATICHRSLSSHQCVHRLQPAIITVTVGQPTTPEVAMATSIMMFQPDPGLVDCHGSRFICHLTAMVRCCCQMPSITTSSTQPPPVFIDPLPPARSVHRPPPLSISILAVYDSELPRICRSGASVGGALLHALPPAIIPSTAGPHHRLLCRPVSPFVHLHTSVISRFRQLPSPPST
jgi:hypothetical protein